MSSEYTLHYLTALTSLRYRKFLLKINKLPTFTEIAQVYQYLKLCFYGQISSHTEFQLPIMF